MNEKMLVRGLKNGSEAAFEEMIREHRAKILGLIMKLVSDSSFHEDILQNTWLLAFRHIEKFRNDCALSSWLYRIASNECFQHHRKNRRHNRERPDELGLASVTAVDTQFCFPDHYANKRIRAEITRLSDNFREPVMLRLAGFDNDEMTAALNITLPATKSRFWRAKQILEKRLRDVLIDYDEAA